MQECTEPLLREYWGFVLSNIYLYIPCPRHKIVHIKKKKYLKKNVHKRSAYQTKIFISHFSFSLFNLDKVIDKQVSLIPLISNMRRNLPRQAPLATVCRRLGCVGMRRGTYLKERGFGMRKMAALKRTNITVCSALKRTNITVCSLRGI